MLLWLCPSHSSTCTNPPDSCVCLSQVPCSSGCVHVTAVLVLRTPVNPTRYDQQRAPLTTAPLVNRSPRTTTTLTLPLTFIPLLVRPLLPWTQIAPCCPLMGKMISAQCHPRQILSHKMTRTVSF